MSTSFKEHNQPLSAGELAGLNDVVSWLKEYLPEGYIHGPELIYRMNKDLPINMTDVKFRKFVNHIRSNAILPLLATSKGYTISYRNADVQAQINSLAEREAGLANARMGLQAFIIDDVEEVCETKSASNVFADTQVAMAHAHNFNNH